MIGWILRLVRRIVVGNSQPDLRDMLAMTCFHAFMTSMEEHEVCTTSYQMADEMLKERKQ